MLLLSQLQEAQSKLEKLIPLAKAYSEPQVDVKGLEPLAAAAAEVGIRIAKPVGLKVLPALQHAQH